ncbi:MAG TPA: HEXXH motif domain-containing protein [Actinophytocola sp.]|uniref:HEXXH motif domain-containing protein n=1 Tax=Actinophytocola sp. TaxID=1872138 RepID=UPI002DDC99E9|nr:HEXXH motif domain-containing protein [Actinophytocola sp.]HEV2778995.1 HEXXH motif domain-containing protein [Actinophytocola sp.]
MTATHVLPPGLVSSIGGAGDRSEIDVLWAGQVSKRLVQLRAILDLVQQRAPDAGEVAGIRHSFAALAAVQRRDPGAVSRLLSGPQVGAWAADCLRRLARPASASATPLWVHLAHLGSVAAAAAVQSDVDIEVLVPVRAGVVALPALGCAVVERPEPWALATCGPGRPILLDGAPPRDWQPVRVLPAPMPVMLDETDPYWRCFGLPVRERVPDAEVELWRRQLEAAWAILAERHPSWLTTVAASVRCLVPLDRGGRFGGLSASSANAPGAVALSEPSSPDRLTATLVHEVQHFRLYALHDLVPLYRTSAGDLWYSPWRKDPRSPSGLLQATAAFLGVADFWSREWPTAGRGAELTYARTVRQLRIGHRILAGCPELTRTGTALVAALGVAIDRLPDAGLADDVRRIAADLTAQHRALWRLRHVVPEPAEVSALATEWLRGEPISPPPAPVDRTTVTGAPGGDSPLLRLATALVEDPDSVAALADAGEVGLRYPGTDATDLSLLTGDYAETQATRLAQIAGGAMAAEVWASLSVAHGRLCVDPSLSPLAARPELVRAAWPAVANGAGAVRNPLAELVSRYVGGTSTSDSMRR